MSDASLNVSTDVLPTGLTVVTVEAPHLHHAMCAVYVRVGSRHESAARNGVSHALEHLFFRGSVGWPDSVEMNAAVEAVGGNLNGVTMRDSSYYYTPCHPDGVQTALEVLGDMLTRPLLRQLATEKRVILEEMLDEVDERGRDVDVDNLTKRILYPRHPLSLKIAGTPRTVRALTTRAVGQHFRAFYGAGNLVVAVAGPVARDAVLRWARRAFRHATPGPRASEEAPPSLPGRGPRFRFVTLDESQVELRLSFPAVPEGHPDATALMLLRRVLDDGLSSRLPFNIVEKKGLAYSVGATVEVFHDAGSFDVDAACAPGGAERLLDEVARTLRTLHAGDIQPAELERAQRRFRMHLDFLVDAPAELCGWFGGTALFRPAESFASRAGLAEGITRDELARVARRYLSPERAVVVAVGPAAARKGLERALGRLPGQLTPRPIRVARQKSVQPLSKVRIKPKARAA